MPDSCGGSLTTAITVCAWLPHMSFVIKIRQLETASFLEKLEKTQRGSDFFKNKNQIN